VSRASASRPAEHYVVLVTAIVPLLALIVLGRVLAPDPRGWGTHEQLGFRPCYPMSHWNVPCPGCGVTTAVVLAVHGMPLASLHTQPFGLVVLASVLASAVWAVGGHVRGRELQQELGRLPWRGIGRTLGLLLLAAWLYKLARVRGWAP